MIYIQRRHRAALRRSAVFAVLAVVAVLLGVPARVPDVQTAMGNDEAQLVLRGTADSQAG